jgi:hypothetical protein
MLKLQVAVIALVVVVVATTNLSDGDTLPM